MAFKDRIDSLFKQIAEKQDRELANTRSKKVRLFDEPAVRSEEISNSNLGTKTGTYLGSKKGHKRAIECSINSERSGFLSFSGVKRKVLISFYNLCEVSSKKLETPRVSIENIAKNCNEVVNTVKTTIKRLVRDGFVRRSGYKAGRGGWTVYALTEEVHHEIKVQLEIFEDKHF